MDVSREKTAVFEREADMTPIVSGWLQATGLTMRSEFTSPWGICDLVGAQLSVRRMAHRRELRQNQPVRSITAAAVLLRIPDQETGKSVRLSTLVRTCSPSIPESIVRDEVNRLILQRFVREGRGGLQRANGWAPLHRRLVAVELKLNRIDEAMRQARSNLGFADQSYVALPDKQALGVWSRPRRWRDFVNAGVGVLAVGRTDCAVLIPARRNDALLDRVIQFYCVERFWRCRSKAAQHERLGD